MDSLQELFEDEMKDIYNAENQLLKTLPKMAKKASSASLKKAFTDHLKQTEGHVARLESVFKLLKLKPEGVPCDAIKGILKEGNEVAEEFAGGSALDAGLIAAAQAVEHYEISRYGALKAWATELGLTEVAGLLGETLSEEEATDELLTGLSKKSNKMAVAA